MISYTKNLIENDLMGESSPVEMSDIKRAIESIEHLLEFNASISGSEINVNRAVHASSGFINNLDKMNSG